MQLENWNKIDHLPLSYRHTVAVGEFRIRARQAGFGWGEGSYKLEKVIPDVYYPQYRIAIEVDTGTESHDTLGSKGERYNGLSLQALAFITTGPLERAETFFSRLEGVKYPIGATMENMDKVIKDLYDIRRG